MHSETIRNIAKTLLQRHKNGALTPSILNMGLDMIVAAAEDVAKMECKSIPVDPVDPDREDVIHIQDFRAKRKAKAIFPPDTDGAA